MIGFNLNLVFLVQLDPAAWDQAPRLLSFAIAKLYFNNRKVVILAATAGYCLAHADRPVCEKADHASIRGLDVLDIYNLVAHAATAKSHAAFGIHFAQDLHHCVMAAAVEGVNQGFLVGRSRVLLDSNGHAESLARHGRGSEGLGLNGFMVACVAAG